MAKEMVFHSTYKKYKIYFRQGIKHRPWRVEIRPERQEGKGRFADVRSLRAAHQAIERILGVDIPIGGRHPSRNGKANQTQIRLYDKDRRRINRLIGRGYDADMSKVIRKALKEAENRLISQSR